MNYLLNHGFLSTAILFAATMLLTVLLFVGLLFLYFKRIRRAPWSDVVKGIVFGGLVIAAVIGIYLFLTIVPDSLSDGRITWLVRLEDGKEKRLLVWFTRVDEVNMTVEYSQRLKSFELESGRLRGKLDLADHYFRNDYRIFAPLRGNRAWGYSGQNGLKLIDLFQPKVLADEKEILDQNPILGGAIRLLNHPFEPRLDGLRVSGNRGEIFILTPDLQARPIESVRFPERRQTQIPPSGHQWVFNTMKGSRQKTVHLKGMTLAEKAVGLIRPKIVPRYDTSLLRLDKVWVAHRASSDRHSPLSLSYLEANGRELIRIKLWEIWGKSARPYTVMLDEGRMFVFVVRDYAGYGFSLYALQVDPETGKILKKIEYFS